MFQTSSRKHLYQMLALTLCVFAFVGIVMMGSATTAFCSDASATIENAVDKLVDEAYSIVRAIIVPICIVTLAVAGFQFLIGGNQGAEKARKAVIGCVAALCFVVFSPMVVNVVAGFISSDGTGGLDNYNPLDGTQASGT